jgi:predicted RNA methylase
LENKKRKSSFPKRKDPLDKLFTKKDTVEFVLSFLELGLYKEIIEPSAGNGSFSNNLKKKGYNCVAYDIEPEHENIITQDYLEFQYEGDVRREDVLVVGNPPFGRLGSLALKFIRKSSEFADTIAFILPKSFKKDSFKDKMPSTYHLISELDVPENSFSLNGDNYDVPCVFQVWKNLNSERKKSKKIEPEGFEYMKKPDLAFRRVGVYAGKVFKEIHDKSIESHYFIKLDNAVDVERVAEELNSIKWKHNNTVGPRSISKNELNKKLNDILNKEGKHE